MLWGHDAPSLGLPPSAAARPGPEAPERGPRPGAGSLRRAGVEAPRGWQAQSSCGGRSVESEARFRDGAPRPGRGKGPADEPRMS